MDIIMLLLCCMLIISYLPSLREALFVDFPIFLFDFSIRFLTLFLPNFDDATTRTFCRHWIAAIAINCLRESVLEVDSLTTGVRLAPLETPMLAGSHSLRSCSISSTSTTAATVVVAASSSSKYHDITHLRIRFCRLRPTD